MTGLKDMPIATTSHTHAGGPTQDMRPRMFFLWAGAIVLFYFLLALGDALVAVPWCDEAWLSNPALTFLRKGYLGTPILTPFSWGPPQFLPNIDHRTYWVMPLHMMMQIGWYKLFGFSLLSLRTLSILWGAVALVSIGSIARSLGLGSRVALIAMLVAGTDYFYLTRASDGRMDMMAAALMLASLAVYLWQRNHNFTRAVALAGLFAAASAFTHPVGGFFVFCGLAVLALRLDRGRLRIHHAFLFAIPFLLIGVPWGIYAAQDFASFKAQLAGNAHGRWEGISNPWMSVYRELRFKYFQAFGLNSFDKLSLQHLRLIPLAVYALSIIMLLMNREERKKPGVRSLLWIVLVFVFAGMAFDGAKRWYYLTHVVPFFAIALAANFEALWRRRSVPRLALFSMLASLVLMQVSGTVYRVSINAYQNEFIPAARFIDEHNPEHSLIMGSGELGFYLGYPDYLVDDLSLGYYTGAKPKLIFAPRTYWQMWLNDLRTRKPEVCQFVASTLRRDYRLVYSTREYLIYQRQN